MTEDEKKKWDEENKNVVINNETGQRRKFKTSDEATAFQEYLVFELGIDAEVLG